MDVAIRTTKKPTRDQARKATAGTRNHAGPTRVSALGDKAGCEAMFEARTGNPGGEAKMHEVPLTPIGGM
jgi:hypothetical protein